MAFTITDFIGALNFGGARANQFEVIIPFPAVSGGTGLAQETSLLCHAASIPGENLGIINTAYFGRNIPWAGDRTFDPWTVTIYNDEPWDIRGTFEQWSNAMNGHLSNLRNPAALTLSGYAVDITVNQYGKTGDIIAEYDMINAFPVNVSPIELGWEGNDQIESFQVTFAFSLWQSAFTS